MTLGVLPTNNGSEQGCACRRASQSHRRLSLGLGGSGPRDVRAVLDTARKRGQTALATLQAILGLPVTLLLSSIGLPTR